VRAHGAPRVDVVPGVMPELEPDETLRLRVRGELGAADNECVFVYAGAVGAANGLDLLLDAVALLPEDSRARFVLAGDGSDRERLERRLTEERLPRVDFLGPVPKARVPELLAAADVCLHLLRPDPVFATAQPTKVLEYFGARRPYITTVPGLPTQLAEESGGGVATSAPELAAELRRWEEMTPAARAERGEAAYAYGSGRFGLAAGADALEAVLERVLTPRAPGGRSSSDPPSP
jgi:glycosyltransferase involved in cell wall biosynthesis